MSPDEPDHDDIEDTGDVRERIEQEADRAIEQFDEGIVDLLAWVLDTGTRARIYVHLRQHPESTSEEIAEGTGLYPSTVREALAELHDEGKVTRRKRESGGAGNNPYEYAAIPPSELVGDVVGDVQQELNTVFNLDQYLGGTDVEPTAGDEEPVTINVEEADEDESDADVDLGGGDNESDAIDLDDDEDVEDGGDEDAAA
jgi:predicted transcriptional regulator